MKASVLKTDRRVETRNDKGLGIQVYGERNDYPQRLIEIINASGTGRSCVGVYAKFISGRGFMAKDFFGVIINRHGQTTDYLLNQIASDYARFGGFCIHVNYNSLYEISSIHHIPFENTRFAALDDNFRFSQIAVHPDWGRRNIKLRQWRKDDVDFIELFNPDPATIQQQVDSVGGWQNYKGQVFYFSNQGDGVYPSPIYDPVLTDMSTEEGLSNIKLRNTRNNFIPAGMVVDYGNTDESKEQEEETKKELAEFQGDENACKLLYIQCKSPDEKPEFTPFKSSNYDKDFEVTEKTVVQNIGRSFMQPPILRAEDVGANFGADLMRNAYNYYNSITENERYTLERILKQLFQYWYDKSVNIDGDFSISPCKYDSEADYKDLPTEILKDLTANERRAMAGFDELNNSANEQQLLAEKLGVGGTQAMVAIMADSTLSDQQKGALIKILFGLTKEQVSELIQKPV